MLEGSIEFVAGDQRRVGGPGFWALVPGGVPHTFGNVGEAPARLLIIHALAADAYFAELQELWGKTEPPTPEEERALMRQHGLEPVDPAPSEDCTTLTRSLDDHLQLAIGDHVFRM